MNDGYREDALTSTEPASVLAERAFGDLYPGTQTECVPGIAFPPALAENSRVQAQIDEAVTARLSRLEQTARQVEETLRESLHHIENGMRMMQERIAELAATVAAAPAAESRVAVAVGAGYWLTKVLQRYLMYLDPDDLNMSPHLAMDGVWEKAVTDAFLARLHPGMTVVDVGTGSGYFTLLAAGKVGATGKVYAFEANPRTFDLLARNLEVNGFTGTVRAHPMAVLDANKQVELQHLVGPRGTSAGMESELQPDNALSREPRGLVDAVPLDEIVCEPVDLMRIDAGGSGPFVFEGMHEVLDRSPRLTVFMEFNASRIRQSIDPRSFLRRIRECGFNMQWITPWNTIEPLAEDRALGFENFTLLLERP